MAGEQGGSLLNFHLANVVVVVDDPDVEKVISAILDTTSTGSAGDGKIFVSPVTDAIDIGTRKRGQTAIA